MGLAAFAFACEDDPQNNPSTNFPEAGTFDANRDPTDSSTPPDASPDAPVTPKGVTVIATGRTGPAANITVLFHDATGAVTETKKTGADGKATSLPTPLPAMATIVFGEGALRRRLLTWTGVADGDELPAIVPDEVDLGTVDVTLGSPADAGTLNYESHVGDCYFYAGTGGEPWSMGVGQYCARGGGALLVRASDTNDATQAFAFKKPIALTVDGGATAATTGNWVAPVNVTVDVTNTTDMSGNAIFSQIVGTTVFSRSSFMGDAFGTSFEAAGPTFADGYNMTVVFDGATPSAHRMLGRRFAPATTTASFDATNLPTALTAASVDETDKRRPIAKWTGSTAGMKGGIARLFWFDASTDGSTSWTIVVPAGGTEVKAPALPATLDVILPAADAGGPEWDQNPTLAFADSTLLPDYGTFRKIQGLVFPSVDEDAQIERAVLPQAGDFKITSWSVSQAR